MGFGILYHIKSYTCIQFIKCINILKIFLYQENIIWSLIFSWSYDDVILYNIGGSWRSVWHQLLGTHVADTFTPWKAQIKFQSNSFLSYYKHILWSASGWKDSPWRPYGQVWLHFSSPFSKSSFSHVGFKPLVSKDIREPWQVGKGFLKWKKNSTQMKSLTAYIMWVEGVKYSFA